MTLEPNTLKAERDTPLALFAAMITDPLQVPAIFVSEAGKVSFLNDAWAKKCDLHPKQVDDVAALVHPDDRNRFNEFFNSAAPSETFRLLSGSDLSQLVLTRFVGKERWIRGVLCVLFDHSSHPVTNDFGVRWQTVFEGTTLGVWDIDFVTGTRYFSKGWSQLRGFGPDNMPSGDHDDWSSRIHPNDLEGVLKRREAIRSSETSELFDEYRERHADGHWIWIMSRGTVVSRDAQGLPTRIIGTDTNISHLKLNYAPDEDLSSRLQLTVSASNIGVWEYDVDAGEVTWDQRTRDLYGLHDEQARWPGAIWETFLHPEDKGEVLRITTRALETRDDYNLRFRIVQPNGAVRHLRSRATHVTDARGKTTILGVTWDITMEAEQAAEIAAAYDLIQQRNEALEEAYAEMEHRSSHDALTGLANRRGLDQFQEALIRKGGPDVNNCAVLQIDLDRFKSINDTLGHAAGDIVLKRVADILRDAAPPNAVVARVGGDEFAVVIPDAPHNAMVGFWASELIRQAQETLEYQGHRFRFNISIGIATGPYRKDTIDTLFSRADLALYEAKGAGRGVMRYYNNSLKIAAKIKRQNSDDILTALEEKQFFCYYQPQYDATGKTITGIEALVRWQHPVHGVLTPDRFLNLADELGVIADIDDLVLKAALRDARRWQAAGRTIPRVFVNISGRRLLDPLLPDRIAFLRGCEIPLGFELLETVFLDQTDPNLDGNLACLRSLGIAIDVDDFGSGHASILSLRALRPDRLKIDKGLVLQTPEDAEQRDLIGAIIKIGRVMGMAVVAEGVETPAHIAVLQDLGCDFLQGYGLCRPIPADQICDLLPPA